MFTRVSVVWAERIVAVISSKGFVWSSAQRASGYSSARRRATSRARPFTVRGLAIGRGGYGLGHSRREPRYPSDVRSLEIKRQMSAADIADVTTLLEAAERADGH